MSLEQIKKRFAQEIKLRAYDDQYVDRAEEKEILKVAIEMNIAFDSARNALCQVCVSDGFVLESAVLARVREMIEAFSGNDGKIDEKEFNDTVTVCKNACKGKRKDGECKRMVVEVMEEGSSKIKKGFLNDWYSRVKQEVGVA